MLKRPDLDKTINDIREAGVEINGDITANLEYWFAMAEKAIPDQMGVRFELVGLIPATAGYGVKLATFNDKDEKVAEYSFRPE